MTPPDSLESVSTIKIRMFAKQAGTCISCEDLSVYKSDLKSQIRINWMTFCCDWGFRYTWYMPLINRNDNWFIWLRYAWDMTEIWLRPAWDMPEKCSWYAWAKSEICLKYAWDIPEICLRYTWYMPVICLRYAWEMP